MRLTTISFNTRRLAIWSSQRIFHWRRDWWRWECPRSTRVANCIRRTIFKNGWLCAILKKNCEPLAMCSVALHLIMIAINKRSPIVWIAG